MITFVLLIVRITKKTDIIIMKKGITAFALMISLSASAQDAVKSISIEALGAQNIVGVNYDARLKGNDGFGYRIGIGYGYGKRNGQTTKGFGIPMEVNYLLGKKKSKLELGFGASAGYYHVEEYGTIWDLSTNEIYDYESKENKFGYFFFGDIGYRYQPTSGMVFRIGVSPSFNFDDSHSIHKAFFYPYISFGLTI